MVLSTPRVARVLAALVATLSAVTGVVVLNAGDASALTNRRVCIYADYLTDFLGLNYDPSTDPSRHAFVTKTYVVTNYKKDDYSRNVACPPINSLKLNFRADPNFFHTAFKLTCEETRPLFGDLVFDAPNDPCIAMGADTMWKVVVPLNGLGQPADNNRAIATPGQKWWEVY